MSSARRAALESGVTTYYSAKRCPHGHDAARYASSGACITCVLARTKSQTEGGYYKTRYLDKRDEFLAACSERHAMNPSLGIARAKAWAKRNPTRRSAIARQYKARRRAQEEIGISGGTLADWTLAQPKACFYCGKDCKDAFHVDHFMPLARGGAHVLTNLRIACVPCNLHKSNRDPRAWIESVTPEMVMP